MRLVGKVYENTRNSQMIFVKYSPTSLLMFSSNCKNWVTSKILCEGATLIVWILNPSYQLFKQLKQNLNSGLHFVHHIVHQRYSSDVAKFFKFGSYIMYFVLAHRSQNNATNVFVKTRNYLVNNKIIIFDMI